MEVNGSDIEISDEDKHFILDTYSNNFTSEYPVIVELAKRINLVSPGMTDLNIAKTIEFYLKQAQEFKTPEE